MDRLFLDANVLFSAAYRLNAGLIQLWKLKNVTLCSSRYALEEARVNLTDDAQRRRLLELSETIHLEEADEVALSSKVFLPEKDKPILRAAVASGATYLLTGDVRHFGRYFGKKVEGVTILAPGDYLRMRTKHS